MFLSLFVKLNFGKDNQRKSNKQTSFVAALKLVVAASQRPRAQMSEASETQLQRERRSIPAEMVAHVGRDDCHRRVM